MSSHIPTDAYLMIVGAMKAGTSSLFRLLQEHPSICAAQAKEPEFFSQHQGHALNVSHYEDLFPSRSGGHALYLEASTGYTKYPEEHGVPLRIKQQGLNPRFIYIVRDPLSRTLSHLNYAILNNHAWASDPLFGFYAVTFSMYYTQLSQYIAHFPDTHRYFIADFDDLKNRPAELTERIYAWLELEPPPNRAVSPANVTPPRSKAELALVRSPLHKFRTLLPASLRSRLKTVLRSRSGSATLDLSDVDRERLHTWLHDDMMAFKHTFGFPVEKWGFVE
jgi:hypothetical protein